MFVSQSFFGCDCHLSVVTVRLAEKLTSCGVALCVKQHLSETMCYYCVYAFDTYVPCKDFLVSDVLHFSCIWPPQLAHNVWLCRRDRCTRFLFSVGFLFLFLHNLDRDTCTVCFDEGIGLMSSVTLPAIYTVSLHFKNKLKTTFLCGVYCDLCLTSPPQP